MKKNRLRQMYNDLAGIQLDTFERCCVFAVKLQRFFSALRYKKFGKVKSCEMVDFLNMIERSVELKSSDLKPWKRKLITDIGPYINKRSY